MIHTSSNKKPNTIELLLNVKPQGFTIVEVLVATLIITVGVGASFALVQNIRVLTITAASTFEASYLAQEGVEIVRNIRDSNFLKIHNGVGGSNWDDFGLATCSAGCQADSTSTSLVAFADTFLQFNSGLYSHIGSGSDSFYKREITITSSGTDVLDVNVSVRWQDRGQSREIEADTQMYNWLSPTP